MAKRSEEEINIINYVVAGASWSKEKLAEIGRAEDEKCYLCGQVDKDITHILWTAPKSMRASTGRRERDSRRACR